MTDPKEARERQEVKPCAFCGGEMTNQYAEVGADEWACSDPYCYSWPMTWKTLNNAYCWKEIATLKSENAELREVNDALVNKRFGTAPGHFVAILSSVYKDLVARLEALAPKQEGKTGGLRCNCGGELLQNRGHVYCSKRCANSAEKGTERKAVDHGC